MSCAIAAKRSLREQELNDESYWTPSSRHGIRRYSGHLDASLSRSVGNMGDRRLDVGGSNENDAIGAIHAALERGINLIDTAPVYGFGRSEEIVGKALAIGGRRKRVFIATKVGLDWKRRKAIS